MRQNFWHGKKKYFFVLLYISDVIAFGLAALLSSKITTLHITDTFYLRFYIFSLLMLIIAYSNYKLYSNKRNLFDDTDFMNIMYSNALTCTLLLIFILMFDPRDKLLITTTIFVFLLTILITTVSRFLLDNLVHIARKKGYDVKRTIFFGDEKDELISKLQNGTLGYKLVLVTQNREVLKKHLNKIDIVFIKMESIDDEMLQIMTTNDQINWKIISSILNLVIDPVAFDEFKDYPIINISNKESTKGYLRVKRLIDVIISGTAIILLSPLYLIIALIMKLTMPGPIFYKQERLGLNLKPFMLYKFRTMKVNADKEKAKLQHKNEVKGLFKIKDDPRITPFGKLLRRSCIDELPQLINIFLGHMSLVGPRPHLQQELSNFEGWRMARFNVKPGLTGLWQVNGRHELNFDKAVLYDIYYVKHMSFILDLTILLKTIPAIIMTKGRY